MKLYATPASPYSRKIRVLLLEKRIPHEVEMVELWEPNALGATNPLGKVPALVLDDGRGLMNSALIADYLDGRFQNPCFIPAEPEARLEVRRWEALADGTMDAAIASLYEMRFHDESSRSARWLAHQRGKIDAGFAALEHMLDGRAWCVGGVMTLADVAIACHVRFIALRAPRFFPQERYPGLAALCARMETLESMRKTAPPRT